MQCTKNTQMRESTFLLGLWKDTFYSSPLTNQISMRAHYMVNTNHETTIAVCLSTNVQSCYISIRSKPKSETFAYFKTVEKQNLMLHHEYKDMAWLLARSKIRRASSVEKANTQELHIPPWQHVIQQSQEIQPLIRVCMLSLLMVPASDWSTLLTVF